MYEPADWVKKGRKKPLPTTYPIPKSSKTKKTEIKHDGIITRVRIYESKRKRI